MHEIDHAVAWAEGGDPVADGVHDADALVAEDAARRTGRHIALEDVQIGAADRRLDDLTIASPGAFNSGLGLSSRALLPVP